LTICIFFFQAEDGIRDRTVTGADVCSSDLIARTSGCSSSGAPASPPNPLTMLTTPLGTPASASTRTRLKVESGVSWAGLITHVRSEERRVGKECRLWGLRDL